MISVFWFVVWCALVFAFTCVVVASISQNLKMKIFKLKIQIGEQKSLIEGQERLIERLSKEKEELILFSEPRKKVL